MDEIIGHCGECGQGYGEGMVYPRNDFNMFTMKPMVSMWYICDCGVSLPC